MEKNSCLRLVLSLVVISLLMSGCSLSKGLKDIQDRSAHKLYATRFEFETRGCVEITSYRMIEYDGRKANYAEIFANTMREEMEKRNLSVTGLIPTKGGNYTLDEIRGKKNFLVGVFLLQNRFVLHYYLPAPDVTELGPFKAVGFEDFSFVNSYETEEEFYQGAKNEFRPVINEMLDNVFNFAKEKSISEF